MGLEKGIRSMEWDQRRACGMGLEWMYVWEEEEQQWLTPYIMVVSKSRLDTNNIHKCDHMTS